MREKVTRSPLITFVPDAKTAISHGYARIAAVHYSHTSVNSTGGTANHPAKQTPNGCQLVAYRAPLKIHISSRLMKLPAIRLSCQKTTTNSLVIHHDESPNASELIPMKKPRIPFHLQVGSNLQAGLRPAAMSGGENPPCVIALLNLRKME